jgi:hypothetical protein
MQQAKQKSTSKQNNNKVANDWTVKAIDQKK